MMKFCTLAVKTAAAWGRKTRDMEGRQQAQTTTDSPAALDTWLEQLLV